MCVCVKLVKCSESHQQWERSGKDEARLRGEKEEEADDDDEEGDMIVVGKGEYADGLTRMDGWIEEK